MRAGLSLLVALAAVAAPAQQAEDVRRLPAAESTAVLVDVVVRDGKDRPVTDLTAADFEVLEDGVLQTVQQFERPKGVAAASANPDGTPGKPASPADSSVASAAGTSGASTMASHEVSERS